MDLVQILPLLSAIFVLGLGIFILLKNIRSQVNVVFVFLTVAVAIWLIGTYQMLRSTTNEGVVFWDRFIYIGVSFVPALFYHFAALFTRVKNKNFRQTIILGYVIGLFFLIMSRTEYFVNDVFYYEWGVHTKAQLFHHLFMVYFAVFIGFLFYHVGKFYKQTTSGLARVQARYVLIAFGCLVAMGTPGFLPAYGVSIYPISFVSGVIFVSILAYAIVKHRFMSIRLIIKKSTVFTATLIVTMALSYFVYNFLIWNFPNVRGLEAVALLVGLVIMQPIRSFFTKIANKYFFADIYNYQEVLRELSHRLTSIIDLDEVVDSIIRTINESFKLEKSGLILYQTEGSVIKPKVAKTVGFLLTDLNVFAKNRFLVQYLEMKRAPLLTDEIHLLMNTLLDEGLKRGLHSVKWHMNKIEASMCVPMLKEGNLIGIILLGRKISKETFSNEDMELIDTLANQASVAIDNALLYRKVKDFNIELQEKVREATIDLKKINRKLKYANANLQQLDKAKSEFLSIASHQLRTPLSGIKGYLSMLLEGDFGKMNDKVNEVVKELFQSADRMSRLINTFLNISRIEANRLVLNRDRVDMAALIKEVIKGLEIEAKKKNLKLVLDLPEEQVLANVDSDKIKDAVINIIDNAIKYTPEGSITIHLDKENRDMIFEVEDTGVGISKKDLENLFEKFSRGTGIAKINTGGSGLGLFIVKKIVEAHGGRPYATSEGKGKGATFGFVMPLGTVIENKEKK